MKMLQLSNINVVYSGVIQALKNVSLSLSSGEIVTLLGANGAGKTSTLKAISGLIPLKSGSITYNDQTINRKSPEEIVTLGIQHVPEGRHIFPGLTVLENIDVATTVWRKRKDSIDKDLAQVFKLFPVLEKRRHQLGWSLSGGEQQMLAIGRALMARPKLLLLDEPSLGLAPLLVKDVFRIIRKINAEQGISILLVEQNAWLALKTSNRGYVLQNGSIVMEGESIKLANNPMIKKAYLGG